MGVPPSEVGYTSAAARRGNHESSYEHVVALEKKIYSVTNCVLKPCVYIQRALIGIGICAFVRFKPLFQLRCEVTNWEKLIRSGLLIQTVVSAEM